jgi:hypothetical protein
MLVYQRFLFPPFPPPVSQDHGQEPPFGMGQLHNSLQAAFVVVLLAGHRLSTFFCQPQSHDSTRKWLGRDMEGWLWSMPSLSGLQNIFRRCLSKRILALEHPLWFGVPQAIAALCCPSADLAVLSSMNRGWEWVDTIVFYMTGWLTSWALVLVVVSWDKLSIFDLLPLSCGGKASKSTSKTKEESAAQWPRCQKLLQHAMSPSEICASELGYTNFKQY